MKINNQSRFRQDWFRFESVRGPRHEGIPDNSAGRVRRLAIVKRYGVPGSNPGPGTNKKVIKR